MSDFTEDVGRFLAPHEAKSMTDAYRERKVAAGISQDEYVRSEYFGIKQVQQLLSQPGCVGLRVHHAKRWEDPNGNPTADGRGELKPRVLLTGVDAKGHDIASRSVHAGTGMKDDGNEEVQIAGDGWTCPKQCGQ
ncbi:MAG: hypothetical protein JWP57_2963 [Spirosoma sp.]|nr:hypothetical protein [Spirosoma sp.]